MTTVHCHCLTSHFRHFFAGIRQAFPFLGLVFLLSGAIAVQAAPGTAEEWYKQADDQYQEGSVDEAIVSLEQALKLKKDYLEALIKLGDAHVENGDFAKAVEPYKRASQLKPNDYAILLNYSNVLEGAGRTEDQLPVLKALFNLNKSDLVTGIKYLTLIEAAGREKFVEDYISLLEELRKAPNADPSYTAKLARAYNKTGKSDKAVKTFNELLKTSPENGEYWAGLAAAQAKTDPAQARESFKKAILFTDRADERARLEKALASLGGAPAAPAGTPAVTTAPAAEANAEKAKADAAALALSEKKAAAEMKAKADADAKAAADAEKKSKAEAAAQLLAEKKAMAEADAKAKADAAAAALAEKKSKEEAAAQAAAAERQAAAAAKAQADADRKAAAEAKAKADADAKLAAEAEKKAKADAAAQALADKNAAAEAEKKAKAEAAAFALAEKKAKDSAERAAIAEAKAKSEADRKAAADAKAKADAEAKLAAEAAAQAVAAERKAKAEAAALTAASEKKAKEDALKLAKEEAARVAKEAAEAKARQDAEKKSQAEAAALAAAAEKKAKAEAAAAALAEKKAAAEAEQKARAEAAAFALAEKKAKDSAERAAIAEAKAKAEADRKAAAEAKAKADADAKLAAEAEKKAKAEAAALAAAADRKAKEDALKLAKEEAARVAKEASEAKARQDAEKKALAEADKKAKEEAARLAKEEAARKAKEALDAKLAAEAEKKALAEADRKAKEEAARMAKEEKERKAKEAAEAKAAAAAEAKARAEADRLAKEEAKRLAKDEADRRAKARTDSLNKVAEERKLAVAAAQKAREEAALLAKAEAERKVKARADSLAKAAEEKRLAAEAATKAREEAAKLAKEEADRKAKEAAEAKARIEAEKKAAAEAARIAKEEAAKLAKEEADRRAKVKADSLARVAEEKRLAAEAERKAKEEAAKVAKAEAERKAKEEAEAKARIEAEKKAAAEAARIAREEAARLAKEEADRRAKARADSLARAEDDRKARLEAERKAKEEAARLAREEAERKAKEEAARKAREEAERQAKAEEERQFQAQVSALLARQGGKLDTTALLIKIQEHRASSKTVSDPRLVEAEAMIHFAQWNFRLVVENLRKLKTLSPSADRLMAVSYFELQDYPSSLKHFQKLPTVHADRQDWGRYIKALLETKQKPKAIVEYEAYLAKYPDADDALAFLIENYRQPLQKEKLIPKLEIQLARNPKDPALLIELIALHDKSNPKALEYRERYLKINPEDNKEALVLAQAYEAKGNTAAALGIYRKLAKENPSDKSLNLKTGELLYAGKQTEEAIKVFEAAHVADPADKPLTLRLAALYEETRKTDKAIDAYTLALETDSKDKAVQSKLLQLLTAKGDKARIRDLLIRIEESDPAAHSAQFQLAKMFLQDGDKEKAYAYLSKALKNQPSNAEYAALLPQVVSTDDQVEQNFSLLEKSASAPAAKPELQVAVARGYAKRKNNAQAARLFAEVYAKSPKLVEGSREAVVALYEAKNFELSGALADKYLASDTKDKGIQEIRVNSFTNTNKPAEKLREAIKGLIAVDPEGHKHLMRLAALDLQAKDEVAAATHAREWLAKNPNDVAGWRFLLPLVAGKPGQEETHIQALTRLVQLDGANKARYELDLGNLQFAKGDFEESEKSLSGAAKTSPGNAALWFRLGETQMKLRKDKEAAEKFKRAYQLDSKNITYARAYGNSVEGKEEIKSSLELFKLLGQNSPTTEEKKKLARAYFLNGDFAGSAREWDALVRNEPALASSEPMVSEAYMKSGQTAKARGLFEQRLQQDPGNIPLLETVADIYKQENNQKGYVATVEKIVAADPKHKSYQLILAVEKDKAGDRKGALEQYGQWVARNAGDQTALKAMHRLAQAEKDTAALMESLTRLNRDPKVEVAYRTQLAEIDYKRSGNLAGIEVLVKKYPEYKQGKAILVKEYIRQNNKTKLIPLEGFLVLEAKSNKDLIEPLADLYAIQKKNTQANAAYLELLKANPKDRSIYEKVRKFSAANDSPYHGEILRIGYENFPEDMDTKKAYAASLGKNPKALDIYREILAKETDVKILAKATEAALAMQQTQAASQFLEKWLSVEAKDPKVWEQALAVHTQLGAKPKMAEDLEQLVRFFPERKELVLQLARLYEEGNQKEKSADMYRRSLALDPKNKVVQSKLVSLLTTLGRKDELKETLLKIDQNDPSAHEAQFQLAKVHLADGEKDRAYVFLGKALRNQPANSEYQNLLPMVVSSDDQVMTHFAALEKPALQPGAKPELQVLVARGYARKKNSVMAARLFSEAYAKNPKLLEGDRQAIEVLYEAKNHELAGALAEKYLATDDKDRAVREIQVNSYVNTRKPPEKLREAIKGLIAVDPEGHKWLMRLAELDLQAKDDASAIAHARTYLDKNPKNVEGWRFLLPLVSKKPGMEETYLTVLEKLAQLDAASRSRYEVELGNLYFAKGNYEEAERAFTGSVKGSPANAALWYRLGETQIKLRKDKEAAEKFKRAYQLESGNVNYARVYGQGVDGKDEIKPNLALFKFLSQNSPSVDERRKLAQALFLNGDFAGSAREFDWLVKSDANIAADPMVADAYMKSGQTAKARGMYEERLKSDPTNLQLLETVAAIYKQEANQKGYVETVERIVAADPKYKAYQLILATEKEKAGDKKGALAQYSQWVSRNAADEVALKAMHRLAEAEKDTALLMEALIKINRDPKADKPYKFQLAEIDYKRSGSLVGVEALVKKYPDYKRGKGILVKEYIRQNNKAKLIPLEGFLVSEARTDRNLLEPLADLYAMQHMKVKANGAYLALLKANPKDRAIFTKVRKFSSENESPYMGEVLRIGYESFPEDVEVKRAYAASLGKTAKALEIYREILVKETDVKVLARAVDIAVTLQQTAVAAQLLEKWISVDSKDPKVWEQALAVHTQLGAKPKMVEDLEQLTRIYPERKELVLQLGRLYEELRQPEKAADMYKRALALDPKNRPVQSKLIALLTASNRKDELRETLLKIDQNDPTAHEAQFQLAKLYLAETDRDRAYVFLGKALRNQPANPEYSALLPQVVVSDDQVMTHFAALEKPALQPGAKPELQILVARGYAKKKNTLMASRLFAEVYSKSPKLVEGNRDAVVVLYDAKNYELAGALAEKYVAANDQDKAIREIQVNSFVNTNKPPERLRAAIRGLIAVDPDGHRWKMRLAALDVAVRDTSAAIVHAREWLDRNPKDVAGWRFLLPLVAKRGGQEEAHIKTLEQLVQLDPGNKSRYELDLGNLYFVKGDYEGAEKALLGATRSSPASAPLWFRLGETQVKLRKEKESEDKFRKAAQLDPTNLTFARAASRAVNTKEEIKASLALFKFLAQNGPSVDERKKLAQAYFLNGDYMNSAKEFDWLLKGDPSIGAVDPMVADAYMKTGQTAKARGLYEQRLVSDPNNLVVLETVAGIYKQEGNLKGYLASIQRIVAVDPKYKGYQLILAVELEKAKDFKGALNQYDAWVVRNPDDEIALKAMHRLADAQKDTTSLMEALVRLNRMKKVEPQYKFQLAELDYARSGNITGIEALVKKNPDYKRGKVILVKAYYKKGAIAKMVPFTAFLAQEEKSDKDLAEPLGDLWAFQKKKDKANDAYFDAVRLDKKDRGLFDKVYKYAKETDSDYRPALLKQGYENFPDDLVLKYDYAITQGKTQKALDLFSEILARDRNNAPALRNAAEISVALRKTEGAVGYLQRWTTLEPDELRPWSLLVELYTQTKEDAKLAEALERMSALTPKNSDLAFRAAMANKKVGNKAKTLELLTKAVALNGTNPAFQKEFGLTLFASGQLPKAKTPLLVADRSMKNDEEINSALFNIYMADKNKGLARERARTLYGLKPFDKRYAYGLARLESDLKNPAEAVKILEKPTLKDGLDAEMSFVLLDGYFKTGQRDRAASWAPTLVRKYPDEAKRSLPLAILFYENKNRAKAKEILEAFVRNTPNEEAFYYLGKVYFDEKNWQGTIDNLTRADETRPDVLSMLGQSYIQNREPEKAIKAYEDYYAKTKDVKVLAELYTLYKKTNDLDGTKAILERLINAQPGNLDFRVELAELYRQKGEVKKAEGQYEMILKKNPTHPASNMNLGMILAGRKDYDRCIKMLEIGLAKYPDSGSVWRTLGDAYRSEKRAASALAAYKRSFKLQPRNAHVAIAKMQLAKELNADAELPAAYADVMSLDSNNVEAASALAAIRFEERKYPEAAALYGRVTANEPGSKSAWANYGYSLLEIKRLNDAKKALQRAVDLGLKDMKLMTSLARIYKEEGNSEKAEVLLTEMVKKDPRNHLAYFWLGQIALERNQPGVAEDFIKKAQLLAPANPDYTEALARMNYNKDEYAAAAKLLELIKGSLTTQGRLMYGDCLMRMGRNEAALAEFNAVYAKDPSAPVLAKLAELQLHKGNGKEAIRIIETSEHKDDTTVQFALAKARIATYDQEKAREILERLIRLNRYHAGYYHFRGLSYYQERNYSKAKKDFDQALKYNPDHMEAVYHTGLCLMKEGRTADAKNYFKELSQHSNTVWQAKGFLGLGLAFESEKKYEAAENFLQKSVNADATAEGSSYLAKVLLKLRKPGDAERHARKALEMNPGLPTAVQAMSDVLLAQNRKVEALAMTKKALQENPNSCELLISSAKINFASGNFETSRSNSTYAISICPEEATPYFYVGAVADKKYNKKEAKDMFKAFKKHGGDETLVPKDYR